MKFLALAAGALAILATAGCAASSNASDKPSPTPTVRVATEKEVASVVAEYADDWQEVIDTATACRLVYVTGAGDPGQDYLCQTREETIGITASLAVKDLRKLNVPSSMESLVDDTDTILSKIALIDVQSTCGDTWGGDDPLCNSALGDRFALYDQLDSKLAAWSPYL